MNRDHKKYWRSRERLLESPALAGSDRPSPEFPDGADLPPDEVSRRTMLKLMGASFALAGTAGCRRPVEHIVPYVDAPEGIIPGVPRYFASTMPLGTAAFGVVVESHEGRPSKVEGNELHAASLGAASSWMQAAVLNLYDPDRSRRHRRRDEAGDHVEAGWDEIAQALLESLRAAEESGGEGFAVLLPAYASPTLARLEGELRERLPAARVVRWDPVDDGNARRGIEIATGIAATPLYHLDRARVVVALDADLLGTEGDALRCVRGFSAGRALDREDGEMLRLYAVESALSTTGGMADHRVRLRSSDIGAFAATVAAELGIGGAETAGLPAPVKERAALIAADLRAAGSAGLVVAGRGQPPAVHALAQAINEALGAIGTTVSLVPDEYIGASDPEALTELVEALRAEEIGTLVIAGGNPVYDAPADLDFGAALDAVENSFHLGTHLDETGLRCAWHLGEATFFEAWGDARAVDGSLSLVQPLIAPLFGGKSRVELLGLLATAEERSGHDLVRETWSSLGTGADDDAVWRRIKHDGVLADSAAQPVAAGGGNASAASAELGPPQDGLEITFQVSRSVYDGSFANNAWMQEAPDPVTKVVWDNPALISERTADEIEVESGDVVRITSGGRSVETPVWVQPGQADGSIALELGYGRRAVGRVGDGVGADVYALRSAAAPWFAFATVEKTGDRVELAQTQEHWSMEDRPLAREGTLAEYRENPAFARGPRFEPMGEIEPHQLFPDHDYGEGYQWGMAIDLNACVGCNACVIACQSENNIPVVGPDQVAKGREMHWLRIDRYFTGDAADPGVAVQPIPCMQCENAPCEQVCPVAATVHDEEGLNAMVYNRCIGTRYCSNNCPYKVRRFNFFNYTKDTPELVELAMNPDVTVRSRGVMEKCTYCVQRISQAKITARKEDRKVADGEIRTACQQTCPADAISFGDLNDADSEVRRRKDDPRDYTLLGELNNRPRTSYAARVGNPNPAWPTTA